MGPILPVNVGAAGPTAGTTPGLNQPGGAVRTGSAQGQAGPTLSRASSDAVALTQIHGAISQLLQNIGGGIEDDKVLRMLIALIILLSLLRDQQTFADSTQNALSLFAGTGRQSQSVEFYFSSTSITIEQTTTTINFEAMDSYATASNGGQVEARGGQIDAAV